MSFITPRELEATVAPIREDVTEIKADVKTLLLAMAARDAIDQIPARSWGVRANKAVMASVLIAFASLCTSLTIALTSL